MIQQVSKNVFIPQNISTPQNVQNFGGPGPITSKNVVLSDLKNSTNLNEVKELSENTLKSGINTQISETTKIIVTQFLKDRLDLFKIVASGGTTGDTALDSVLKGVIEASREQGVKQNKKYFIFGALLLLIGLFGKKIKSLLKL